NGSRAPGQIHEYRFRREHVNPRRVRVERRSIHSAYCVGVRQPYATDRDTSLAFFELYKKERPLGAASFFYAGRVDFRNVSTISYIPISNFANRRASSR